MGKAHSPRHGSLQVWPRVRARHTHAKIRSYQTSSKPQPLCFAGYKAGMTRILAIENRAGATTKGMQVVLPVTIIECPPLKVVGITAYKKMGYGSQKVATTLAEKFDKHLSRTLVLPKSHKPSNFTPEMADSFRLLVHTQPALTGLAKKRPETFEIPLGGKKEEQLQYAKDKLGKDLIPQDVFGEGDQVDCHAITKGKGFQGATRRNRTTLRQHKAEKGQRGPANVGSWTGNRSWTVAHPGQMGYHQRSEYNKWLVKMGQDPKDINPSGGLVRFGVVKNPYMLIKGSVGGPKKRLIKFTQAIRPNTILQSKAPQITFINKGPQQ
ncbi:MAG TPA: 50S ribosomal protein L3 [Candidatus Nanoarchaeia archaeon]|nr:50S ribosomal protein L3 [Candidatus Nanoarchaeia archaeon]